MHRIYLVNLAFVLSRKPSGGVKRLKGEDGFLQDAHASLDSLPAPLDFKKGCSSFHSPKKASDNCYLLEAGSKHLLGALVLYTGNYKDAKQKLGERVDRVRIVALTNPDCKFVKSGIKTFAPTMVGPSSIQVSKYHSKKAISNLLLGASANFKSKYLPIGKFNLDVSYEYNNNQMEEKREGSGLTFRANAGETCTPSVMHTFFACDGFEAQFSVGTLGRSAKTVTKVVPPMLIPIDEDGTVKKSHYGCIDYS